MDFPRGYKRRAHPVGLLYYYEVGGLNEGISFSKIVIIIILLIIIFKVFMVNGGRMGSSVTVPAKPIDHAVQRQDELREKRLCESGGGFFHGSGLGCEYRDYTILNEEIIEHD